MKKNNSQVHATLLAVVGGYVLYIAWHLLENLQSGADDMPFAAAVTAITLFTLAGLGVLGYAWHVWRSGRKADENGEKDDLSKN